MIMENVSCFKESFLTLRKIRTAIDAVLWITGYSSMDKNSESGLSTRRRWVTVQIIVDIIIWLTVALPTLYLFLQGIPSESGFFCNDDSLGFPYRPDTVTTPVLILAGFSVSVLTIVLTEVLNCVDGKCRRPCQPAGDIIRCVKSYAVFLVGFIIQELAVEIVKNKMGVLRPNFFDVCRPKFNRTLCPGYITEYTCTGNEYGEHTVRDTRKSFPSGHAAFSMYIATFFCIYIQNHLQIHFSRILKIFLQAGLVFLAILCGLGRIKDNKHHPSDVIAGFILGVAVAVFVCRTVGRELLKSGRAKCPVQLPTYSSDKSRGSCCSGEQTPDTEPHTPSPLLPNEYFHRSDSACPTLKSVRNCRTVIPVQVKSAGSPDNV